MLLPLVMGLPSRIWRPGGSPLSSTSLIFNGCTVSCDRDIPEAVEVALTSEANMTWLHRCSAKFSGSEHTPTGFLLVANNPRLDEWATPEWLDDGWVVVRFNHCGVSWPEVRDARHPDVASNVTGVQREVIMQRATGPTDYMGGGDGQMCADALHREVYTENIALIGGQQCDVPILRVDGHTVSSGSIMALWLLRHFPSSSIVCAGFDQHKDEKERGRRFEGHAWGFEERLFPAMERTKRVHVVNSEEAMLNVRYRVRKPTLYLGRT